jgi:putative membrane protein
MAKGPVLIELDADTTAAEDVNVAAPLPEVALGGAELAQDQNSAMQIAARVVARKPSFIARLFWAVTLALLGAVISVAAWDFANGLIERLPILGLIVTVLMVVFIVMLLLMALRELAALSRLSRIDGLRHAASEAYENADLTAARAVTTRLIQLYKGREDTRWGRSRFAELERDQMDADGVLSLAEIEILGPMDAAAQREVEAAARQVATVTALVPLALADVAAALTSNLRMIRRIAEVYGGRSGLWGSWRLTRAVLTHLVATGAVAVGDDMLEPILGGSILGKLSRRFGEGVVNGALTARVGVAAIEVCRPLPFHATKRPRASGIVKRALAGLFQKNG